MRLNQNNWPSGSPDSASNEGDVIKGQILIRFTVPPEEAKLALHMIPNLLGEALAKATIHHCQGLEVTQIAKIENQ